MNLSNRIAQIVDEHSGGLKLTELIPLVIDFTRNDDFIEQIEGAVDKHPKLDILDYVADMGGFTRAKQFIYRKEV